MIRVSRAMHLASALLIFSGVAHATTDEDVLRDRLTTYHNRTHKQQQLEDQNWQDVATQLIADSPETATTCEDINKQVIFNTYVLTTDASGAPCRIYDLSFPTLQTLFSGVAFSHLPVQAFHAGDYLNWMDGNYDRVQNTMSTFRQTMDPGQLAGWVRDIRFLPGSAPMNSTARVATTGLPVSFHASDIELGGPLLFSNDDKQTLQNVLQLLGDDAGAQEQWQQIVDRPASLLEHVRFQWNDLNKIYDIFIEGQFLPVRGPIALVDYNASYKIAVESILRSVLQSALDKLVGFVPAPAQNIVSIALDDAFQFVDMAYDYQINKMEGALNHAPDSLNAALLDRGLNILAGGRANIVNQYILALAQQRTFDWTQFEDMGRTLRYDAKRARDVEITNLNSSMVLDGGCSMNLVYDYFGVCTKGSNTSLYSMISDTPLLFWNLGAPLVYNYDFKSEVLLRRGTAYVLSIGARMLNLPYVGFLTGELASLCKDFAFAGITDEAFLRSSYNVLKIQNTTLDAPSQELYGWLFLQNINGFLPKTEAQENSVIQANRTLLGL